MSACKTGCGAEARNVPFVFCVSCHMKWLVSPEWARANAAPTVDAMLAARVDFASRVRAERQNEVRP